MRRFLVTALALAAGLFGPPAIAMHIDFTDRAFWADGTLSKMIAPDIEMTLSATGGPISFAEAYDGDTCTAGLACERDGIGIGDDEITNHSKTGEALTIRFSQPVFITGLEFLDLFRQPEQPLEDTESAMIKFDGGAPLSIAALGTYRMGGSGYRKASFERRRVSEILLFADTGNDEQAEADFALAALTLTPVPVPPSMALALTGVLALGWVGRRRRSAEGATRSA